MPETTEIRLQLSDALPAVCLACGAPATIWKEKEFEIDQDMEAVRSTENVIVGMIKVVLWLFALFTKPSVRLRLPWCSAHRRYWLWRSLAYRSCLLAGFILFFTVLGSLSVKGADLHWCVMVIALCCFWMLGAFVLYQSSIRPLKVTTDSVTLTGVASEFGAAMDRQRPVDQGLI